jgi:hypothetical protein
MTPAGGVVSTARDLLKWNKFLRENKLFEELTKTTVVVEDDVFYGLGIITDKNKVTFFHTGAIAAAHLQGILFTCMLCHDSAENSSLLWFDVVNITDSARFHSSNQAQLPNASQSTNKKIPIVDYGATDDALASIINERFCVVAQECAKLVGILY